MQPDPAVKHKVKGPRIRTAVLVFVLGIAALAPGIWQFASGVWDVLNSQAYVVPGIVRLHLDSGTYIVYERTGPSGSTSFIDRGITLSPSQVRVTDPNGGDVSVRSSVPNETISQGSGRYVAAVEFTARTSGRYAVRVASSQPGAVIITNPLGDIVRDNVGWLLLIVLGGILVVLSVVLLIVGIVRRSRAAKAQIAYPGGAPAPYGAAPYGAAPYGAVPSQYGVPPVATPTPTPTFTPPVDPTPGVAPEVAATPEPSVEPTVPTPPATPMAPAGWFPDPHGQRRLRYWDGSTWTEHTAD